MGLPWASRTSITESSGEPKSCRSDVDGYALPLPGMKAEVVFVGFAAVLDAPPEMCPLIVTGKDIVWAWAGELLGSCSKISGSLPTASFTVLNDHPPSPFALNGMVVQPWADLGGSTFTSCKSPRLTPVTETLAGSPARTPSGKTCVI